jgi:hypothetical protein
MLGHFNGTSLEDSQIQINQLKPWQMKTPRQMSSRCVFGSVNASEENDKFLIDDIGKRSK